MKCDVCGQEYGLAHNCAGIAPGLAPEEAAPHPQGFAPLYYLRMAFAIARWDDVAIRRASQDFQAGVYGALLWTASATLIIVIAIWPQFRAALATGPAGASGVVIGLFFGLAVVAGGTLLQLSIIHFVARKLLGATGTFLGVLRPLLLGWFVNLLILIPGIGLLAAGVAWTAVLMLVFEEVDGIERIHAFLLSAGVNLTFTALQFALRS